MSREMIENVDRVVMKARIAVETHPRDVPSSAEEGLKENNHILDMSRRTCMKILRSEVKCGLSKPWKSG